MTSDAGKAARYETLFLTSLTSEVKRKKYLVVDIESKDGDSDQKGFTRPFMVGTYDGADYVAHWNRLPQEEWGDYCKEGGCVDEVMRSLLVRKYRGHSIYAHNGGRFDFLFFLPWLMNVGRQLGFRFAVVPVASSIQVLDVWRLRKNEEKPGKKKRKKHKAEWRFVDSYKLIPTSLDKAGHAFGLGGKEEHDLDIPEGNRLLWERYNHRDCKLAYEVVERFHHYIETVLQGEVGITAPSTAMKLYRRRFLPRPIYRTVKSHEFIRESYCGGRCEDFIREGKNLYYYDINSSYPASMLEKMPVGPGVHWQGNMPPSEFTDADDFVGFVRANVFVPEMNIPPLPIKPQKIEGVPEKLIFPVGNLSGIWEWNELRYAIERGARIDSIEESWWYQADYLFREYVDVLYAFRDKSRDDYDAGLSEIVKIMLNALYGKFGQRTVRTKLYTSDDPDCPPGAKQLVEDDIDCEVMKHDEETDSAHIIPQVSARITALSRVKLARFMDDAEKRSGKVYYCDTDSLLPDVTMPTSKKLGDLKLEYPEHAGQLHGTFLGPKLYMLQSLSSDPFYMVKKDGQQVPVHAIVRAKGFQERTKEVFDIISKGETVFNQKLEKIGSMARRNFASGPKMLTVPRTVLALSNAPEIQGTGKRIANPDGTTRPYVLKMW